MDIKQVTVDIPLLEINNPIPVEEFTEENVNKDRGTKWGRVCSFIKTPVGKALCSISGVFAIGSIGYGLSVCFRNIKSISSHYQNSTDLLIHNKTFSQFNVSMPIGENSTQLQDYVLRYGFTQNPAYNYTKNDINDWIKESLNTTTPYSETVISSAKNLSEKVSVENLYKTLFHLDSIGSNVIDYSKCGGYERIINITEACKNIEDDNKENTTEADYTRNSLNLDDKINIIKTDLSEIDFSNYDYDYDYDYEDLGCGFVRCLGGPIDFIEYNRTDVKNRYFLSKGYDDSVSYIKSVLGNYSLPIHTQEVQFYCDVSGCKTQNIFTYIPGNSGQIITIGAHLDSVYQGKGINDNGSGVAALVEIVRIMKESNQTFQHSILFAWWGVEENGLQGSEYFVNSLSNSDNILKNISDIEKPDILCYLNMDMLGSKNGLFLINQAGAPDIRTGHRHINSPRGSDHLAKLLNESLIQLGVYSEGSELLENSDHAAFAGKNIPVVFLFTGAGSNKTEDQARMVGGTANEPYDSCYHKECDDINNVDMEMLHNATKAMTNLLTRLSLSTDIWG